MFLSEYVWMLVPYTEEDPIWQKIEWKDSVSVGGALTLLFKIDAKLAEHDELEHDE
jgi:hypothetical protein